MSYLSGDFVECVEEDFLPSGQRALPRQVFRLLKVLPALMKAPGVKCTVHGPKCSEDGFDLDPPGPLDYAWCAGCFRPIYRPKIDWEAEARKPIDPAEPEKVKRLARPKDGVS